ncbi:hypothetical protein [Pseudoalteromonas sp. APC 3218]|uniref:hypothetical protein n=1 Tax=Pseudoalteromonas sp. APC 3218 TaxID=3035180 RepID=UPI0025B62862|nr:hypothetical protein [Pseudoalteromonas sp. APC 3218]MDN3404205.1 hypothetical protein [Pseudoalteromonas sp. APC 3218]
MVAKRQDQSVEVWLYRGDNLLEKIKDQGGLYREVRTELNKLKKAKKSENLNSIEASLEKLNSKKYELGSEWKNWLTRNRQKIQDEKRTKFYVSKEIYERILKFTLQSEFEDNNSKSIEQLFLALDSLGLTNISSIYDLQELLKPYADTYSNDYSTIHSPVTLSNIIKELISELATSEVHDFKDLYLFKKNDEKLRHILSKNSKLQDELESNSHMIERLKKQVISKSVEIKDLKQQNTKLKVKKAIRQSRAKRQKSNMNK